MPYAQINGQQLYFEDTGETVAEPGKLAPTLVFSHGLLMDHSMFAPQVDAFRHRYRCVGWDARAHGRSAGTECAPFTYDNLADDLFALLDHLEIEQAILVGMSQGGFVSLRAALRKPKRVRALILIDSQAGTEDPAKLPAYDALIAHWEQSGLDPATAATIEQIVLGQGWSGAAEWKQKWSTLQPHNLRQAYTTLVGRDDLGDRVGAIEVPVLLIHGAADIAIPLARAEALAAALPDARLKVVAGAGHAANLTHPEPVNALIEDFLTTLD